MSDKLINMDRDALRSMVEGAVAAERERCAKIAEVHDREPYANQIFQGVEIARKIRGYHAR